MLFCSLKFQEPRVRLAGDREFAGLALASSRLLVMALLSLSIVSCRGTPTFSLSPDDPSSSHCHPVGLTALLGPLEPSLWESSGLTQERRCI